MGVFRSIRSNKGLNKVVRNSLKYWDGASQKIFSKLIKRWPTSGTTVCVFNNIEFKMENKCDDWIVHSLFYNTNYHEKTDLQLFINLAQYSRCILDIGANTGVYSILTSKSNPKAIIYAFEPYLINAQRLKKNISLNELENIKIIQEAVGEENGSIEMAVPLNDSITDVSSMDYEFSKSIYENVKWQKVQVPITTIDNFRKTIQENVNLIKCDVETFEMSVFKGLLNTLKQDRPTILFECFLDQERQEFFNNILSECNYYLYFVLNQGVVYSKEGFVKINQGFNFLITPVKPLKTFIGYEEKEHLINQLLYNPQG
jgi:FkbM family methyltransferase